MTQDNGKQHRKAVRFFWSLLAAASTVSLLANVAHAALPYIPTTALLIAVAAVAPIAQIAAVHGMALALRAGASGHVYWATVSAVGGIALGGFLLSFMAQQELMRSLGHSPLTAWIFPVIVDASVSVSTMMLLVLQRNPPVHATAEATATQPVNAKLQNESRTTASGQSHMPEVDLAPQRKDVRTSSPSGRCDTTDRELAESLVLQRKTTKSVDEVCRVIAAHRGGASISQAAKLAHVNYRTAQRIIEGLDGLTPTGVIPPTASSRSTPRGDNVIHDDHPPMAIRDSNRRGQPKKTGDTSAITLETMQGAIRPVDTQLQHRSPR